MAEKVNQLAHSHAETAANAELTHAIVACRRMMNPRLERTQKAAAFKAIGDKCKRCKLCPWCGSVNGTVKYVYNSVCLPSFDLRKLLSVHHTSIPQHACRTPEQSVWQELQDTNLDCVNCCPTGRLQEV